MLPKSVFEEYFLFKFQYPEMASKEIENTLNWKIAHYAWLKQRFKAYSSLLLICSNAVVYESIVIHVTESFVRTSLDFTHCVILCLTMMCSNAAVYEFICMHVTKSCMLRSLCFTSCVISWLTIICSNAAVYEWIAIHITASIILRSLCFAYCVISYLTTMTSKTMQCE